MKTFIYIIACAAGVLVSANSCKDFLDVPTPGDVDKEFVFSSNDNVRAAMNQVYLSMNGMIANNLLGNGLGYGLSMPGTDITRHPEGYNNQPTRHIPEGFYENGTATGSYNIDAYGDMSSFFSIIVRANIIINAMKETEAFQEYMSTGTPSPLSHLYGEAVCARATLYREMITFYGDVPFTTAAGVSATGMAPRDSIYDVLIEDVETVIPYMYYPGSIPDVNATDKSAMSRTFAEITLARLCFDAAGYQTRRPDFKYVDGEGNELSFEKKGKDNAAAGNAFYGRRTDYKKYYEKAYKYLGDAVKNHGNIVFHDSDPRTVGKNGEKYDNPFQYFFQQMMEAQYPDESIYESPTIWNEGTNSEIPYAHGRPSNGGSSNAFPCKNYGQTRGIPAVVWGIYDPKDLRRDVTWSVTGSTGAGQEIVIPFTPNSKSSGGGIAFNKWDENRQSRPNTLKQRKSGINYPYMRISELYLAYAEACAVLGKDAEAKTYLSMIRERAFPKGEADVDGFIAECGSMLNAVLQERAFEYAGEADRRWTMIRTGTVGESIKKVKTMMADLIAGLKKDGYYTFENGNQFSNYIWTKYVDAKSLYGYRLTTQCPDENDPVLFPGWRGQHNDWYAAGVDAGVTESNIKKNLKYGSSGFSTPNETNLAIKGLYKYIDPNGPEAEALEADGYKKVEYGALLVKSEGDYVENFFRNYDYESAPIYMVPFTNNQLRTIQGLSNGYGFQNPAPSAE
ncbi:MAG: RagB/SusD family nutrient uptake outer membrane protein [Bacteroidales bacterium]|nr:RagB/SusD family nutrient uptake outer membrane protein [Bacteroidales bacterium]